MFINIKCQICGLDNFEPSHTWKTHKIKQSDYYHKYHPRLDLFSKELIPFKSTEQYFGQFFINKNNLKSFLSSEPQETIDKTLIDILQTRRISKSSLRPPTQFEIRSLVFPTISYLNKKFGPQYYSQICEKANFKVFPLNYNIKNIEYNSLSYDILVDTRENTKLNFNHNIIVKKLDYGDYCCSVNPQNLFIERKSLSDLCGTISGGNERFRRELDRAKKDNGFILVIIEEKYSHLSSFNYLPHMKKVQASPEFILKQIRDILNNYNNVQFLCVDGRAESVKVIEKIFQIKDNIRELDFQYYYDIGLL